MVDKPGELIEADSRHPLSGIYFNVKRYIRLQMPAQKLHYPSPGMTILLRQTL